MKKFSEKLLLTITLGIALSISVSAQTRQEKSVTSATVKLTTPTDTLQYTLGAFMGQWINNNGFAITNQELFKRGLSDVL